MINFDGEYFFNHLPKNVQDFLLENFNGKMEDICACIITLCFNPDQKPNKNPWEE